MGDSISQGVLLRRKLNFLILTSLRYKTPWLIGAYQTRQLLNWAPIEIVTWCEVVYVPPEVVVGRQARGLELVPQLGVPELEAAEPGRDRFKSFTAAAIQLKSRKHSWCHKGIVPKVKRSSS